MPDPVPNPRDVIARMQFERYSTAKPLCWESDSEMVEAVRPIYLENADEDLQALADAGLVVLPSDEVERLREQIAWTVKRCNEAMGDGFNGTPNSAVAAVCDIARAALSDPSNEGDHA